MQFRVPQFIDIEDKVVGPLTLKQFGYIIGAGGLSFIIWTFVSIRFIAIILIVLVSTLFLSLAFVKINNRSFGEILESAFRYFTGSKVYTWKQPTQTESVLPNEPNIDKVVAEAAKDATIAKVSKDRLHEISLGLDVLDRGPKEIETKE